MMEYYCGFMYKSQAPMSNRRHVFTEKCVVAEDYEDAAIKAEEALLADLEDKGIAVTDLKLVSQSCVGPCYPL